MSTKTLTVIEGSWEVTVSREDTYSSDEMIDAYLQGHKEGIEQAKALVTQALEQGIKRSGEIAQLAVSYFSELGVFPSQVFLRANSAFDFSILVGISESDLLSDKVMQIYDYLAIVEEENSEEFFNITFTISDLDGEVDETEIRIDGYFLKLRKL